MINSPARYYKNGDFISDCFAKLGPHIRSCHAKDIILRAQLTVHLDECRPGTGGLDYGVYLSELSRLDLNLPVMLEHLPDSEYAPAADHLRNVASELHLKFQ
jgi:sugar phosphate isomerase/epimerase